MPREGCNRFQPINVEQFYEKELQQIHECEINVFIVTYEETTTMELGG